MVNIIVQLSKYLMILMITVYTYLCFSIFGYYDPDKKKRCLRKQNVLMICDASDGISCDVSGKKRYKDFGIVSDAGDASWRNDPVV